MICKHTQQVIDNLREAGFLSEPVPSPLPFDKVLRPHTVLLCRRTDKTHDAHTRLEEVFMLVANAGAVYLAHCSTHGKMFFATITHPKRS